MTEEGAKRLAMYEEAVKRYMDRIRGEPLEYQDVLARFLVYATTLMQVYNYSAHDFATALALASKCDLSAEAVPSAKGRAN